MDFSSILNLVPQIIEKIEGPIGIVSLIVILFSFVTWAFFSRAALWFRVFALVLLFIGCGGVAYAVLLTNTFEVEKQKAQVVDVDTSDNADAETPENTSKCSEGVYKEFGTACIYFHSRQFAEMQIRTNGPVFAYYVKGPVETVGYTCSDPLGCRTVKNATSVYNVPVLRIKSGLIIYGYDPETSPSAHHKVEITFPDCSHSLSVSLGPLNVTENRWNFAQSTAETSLKELPLEWRIEQCGTAGQAIVRFHSQAGTWKTIALSRFDLLRAVRELRALTRQF